MTPTFANYFFHTLLLRNHVKKKIFTHTIENMLFCSRKSVTFDCLFNSTWKLCFSPNRWLVTAKQYKNCFPYMIEKVNWSHFSSQAPATFHSIHTSALPALCHLAVIDPWVHSGLMVGEPWHGKGPGKSFNTVAQICDASHSFWVLKKEVLEVLELSCKQQQKREMLRCLFLASSVSLPLEILSSLMQQF